MIVVGYIYNDNGMATWCIETALALHESGTDVLLLHAPGIQFPKDFAVPTLAIAIPIKTRKKLPLLFQKLNTAVTIIRGKTEGLAGTAYDYLSNNGYKPQAFIFNQSSFVNGNVPIPQYVCGWVSPFNFTTYIKSGINTAQKSSLKNVLKSIWISFAYWRMDVKGFKSATRIFALTPAMHKSLTAMNFRSVLLSPCCNIITKKQDTFVVQDKVKVVISSQYLDNPRKKIPWILQTLNRIQNKKFVVTLIGEPGEMVQELAHQSTHIIAFAGKQPRDNALKIIEDADIFLFASVVDDWGYVIVEAMSRGLAVLVPDKEPYDYIVGSKASVFEPQNQEDFTQKLLNLSDSATLEEMRLHNLNRASTLFGRERFANDLNNILFV